MLKFDYYRFKDEGDPKIIITLDWYSYEDHWSQRYMFDRPMWDSEMMDRMKESNERRCKWFRIAFNIFHFKVNVDIKLKHIGNVYRGRVMNDGPEIPSFVKRNREKKKQEL